MNDSPEHLHACLCRHLIDEYGEPAARDWLRHSRLGQSDDVWAVFNAVITARDLLAKKNRDQIMQFLTGRDDAQLIRDALNAEIADRKERRAAA